MQTGRAGARARCRPARSPTGKAVDPPGADRYSWTGVFTDRRRGGQRKTVRPWGFL